MKKSDLLETLENELLIAENDINSFKNETNPHLKEFYYIAIGKKDMLDATIHYIKNGSKIYF